MPETLTIREAIRRIIEEDGYKAEQLYTLPCTVDSVDKDLNVCTVTTVFDENEITDVRLQAVEGGGDGMVIYPKEGSSVLVTFLNKTTGFVSAYSDVDKFSFKNGSEDLKALLEDLISAIEVLTVNTAMGPSATPINASQFSAIKNRISNLFE